MLRVFLSHNSADKPQVENIGCRLRESGFEPRLDKWDMPAGDRWQEWLERELMSCDACLIFFGQQGWGPWHDAEMRVALDRSIGKKNLRIIPVLLPDVPKETIADLPSFLRAYNAVQFRQSLDDKDAFARLVAGIRGEALGSNVDMDNLPNPYRGLQVFDIEHAPFFFGREAAKTTLLQQISQTLMPAFGSESLPRFLALVGASGSGKSSLARAGLLASLKNGALASSQNWSQLLFKPGEKPLQSLAIAINAHNDWRGRWSTSELIEKFCQHPLQLHYLALELLHGIENCYVLILVDQFEELFTLCKDRTIQQAFLDNLLNAATDPTGKVFVLLTLRSDFYTHCTNFPSLSRLLETRQHIVNPLSEQELQQAIEWPVRQVGIDFELGLTALIVKDAQEQPGTLPLLQYALTQLWEQRKTRILRLQDYQAFGGLAGALEQRANQLYGNFSSEAKEQCRLVFRRLVQPGEGTVDTRRRSRLDEFGQNESMHQVIRHLTDARLLTTQRTEDTAFIEVSHEALIRGWSQLREWVNG